MVAWRTVCPYSSVSLSSSSAFEYTTLEERNEEVTAAYRKRRIVVALCGSKKKHQQTFEKLRIYLRERNYNGNGNGRCQRGVTFLLKDMLYDENQNEFPANIDEYVDVDIVLHKVSTLNTKAVEVLQNWCAAISEKRVKRLLPPVIVIDPIEMTQLMLQRSRIVSRLNNVLPQPLFSVPRSWLWKRCHKTGREKSLSPLTQDIKTQVGPTYANGDSKERWWIAKPDLCSGPVFAHCMVVWKGNQPGTSLPYDVQQLLPSEASVFVVEEFFVNALPVILKVYCIDNFFAVKAVSTAALLQCVETGAGRPVQFDSQSIFKNNTTPLQDRDRWKIFLENDIRTCKLLSGITAQLTQTFGLTLFGFDLLLLPTNSAAASNSHTSLLDSDGNPTLWLRTATPVLVDVNYFPGFAGVDCVAKLIFGVLQSRVCVATESQREEFGDIDD